MDFAEDLVGGEAAGFAADVGDDAEGAAVVAAVLDFEDGAGVVGFATLDGSGEEFGVGEDVAREDLGGVGGRGEIGNRGGMGRNELRPYKLGGRARQGKKRIPRFARNDMPPLLSVGASEQTGAIWVRRAGIWGLWELPTTQETPGKEASSSGARWA